MGKEEVELNDKIISHIVVHKSYPYTDDSLFLWPTKRMFVGSYSWFTVYFCYASSRVSQCGIAIGCWQGQKARSYGVCRVLGEFD